MPIPYAVNSIHTKIYGLNGPKYKNYQFLISLSRKEKPVLKSSQYTNVPFDLSMYKNYQL